MDAQRFDAVAKAMANGATRRRALRLAGGALAGALLTTAGLGRRAGAKEESPSCDDILVRCQETVGDACREEEDHPNMSPLPCYVEKGGAACRAYVQACNLQCGLPAHDACAGRCPNDTICLATVNAAGRLLCRCLNPD